MADVPSFSALFVPTCTRTAPPVPPPMTCPAFSAISSIFAPDRKGLSSQSEVRCLYDTLLDAFACEVSRNHPDDPSRILVDVARILSTTATISTRLSVVIAQFRIDQPPDGCLKFCEDVHDEEAPFTDGDNGQLQPKEEVSPVSA
ncbi:hypothetical protein LSAT2_020685 [Lamellibrachia satsuma]|nr:hypothetical protein LSAT2_020685 [Lamellibrachia satsuma]